MRMTELFSCDKDCVYRKDGFCSYKKRSQNEAEKPATINGRESECAYYESRNGNKKSDSRLEAFFS